MNKFIVRTIFEKGDKSDDDRNNNIPTSCIYKNIKYRAREHAEDRIFFYIIIYSKHIFTI